MKSSRFPGIHAFSLLLVLAISVASVSCAKRTFPEDFDNPIIRDIYSADVAALVHRGSVYIYTGHDTAPEGYQNYIMDDWYVFSTKDFQTLENHGPALSVRDFRWANGNAWASQVIERNGKFYWYVSVDAPRSGGMAIGVAIADNPTGPFHDALGEPLITSDMTPYARQPAWTWDDIDPTVFIDNDGQAYLYFGNSRLKYVKLNEDMISVDVSETESALVRDAIVEVSLPRVDGLAFTEAPWLHFHDGLYYLTYAAGWEEQIAYCVSDSPTGPWRPGSVIMTHAFRSNTSHPAIIEYKGNWFMLYHNGSLPGGGSYRRSVCVDRLRYNEEGEIEFIVPSQERFNSYAQ